jgi:recombination protein RecA
MRLGQQDRPAIAAISTGALALDIALGVGGLPRGRCDRNLRAGSVGQNHAGSDDRSPRRKKRAAWRPSWTPNTRLTRPYARALGIDLERLLRVAARNRRGGS